MRREEFWLVFGTKWERMVRGMKSSGLDVWYGKCKVKDGMYWLFSFFFFFYFLLYLLFVAKCT